jgi:hypothetical protein
MNASFSLQSARSRWVILISILGFWLSSSLLIDVLVMPCLYLSGMLIEPLFANSGYLLFSLFNRVELLFAAVILAYVLGLGMSDRDQRTSWPVWGAVLLLGITLISTYVLTPAMGAMAVDLDLFNTLNVPSGLEMRSLHVGYLGLEAIKLLLGFGLLRFCAQQLAE